MNDINKCSPSWASSQQTAEQLEMQVSSFINPPSPFCQIEGDTYLDVDMSGHYSDADMVFGYDGIQLSHEQVQNKLKMLGYSPDFVGCFAASAPTCYGDIDQLRLKHGMWPENFSVIAAVDQWSVAYGNSFTYKLSAALAQASSAYDTQEVFRRFAYENEIIENAPIDGVQTSVGRLGVSTGWAYQVESVGQDALHRYLIVIMSNDQAGDNHHWENWDDTQQRIVDKYQLLSDHVYEIDEPESEEELQQALQTVAEQLPAKQKNEVMIVYNAHGFSAKPETNWTWSTLLYNGYFNDTILTENQFRDLMIDSFSSEKTASVLLIVGSCFSGLLVAEKPAPYTGRL